METTTPSTPPEIVPADRVESPAVPEELTAQTRRRVTEAVPPPLLSLQNKVETRWSRAAAEAWHMLHQS